MASAVHSTPRRSINSSQTHLKEEVTLPNLFQEASTTLTLKSTTSQEEKIADHIAYENGCKNSKKKW